MVVGEEEVDGDEEALMVMDFEVLRWSGGAVRREDRVTYDFDENDNESCGVLGVKFEERRLCSLRESAIIDEGVWRERWTENDWKSGEVGEEDLKE